MTRDEIIALIDREIKALDETSAVTGLSDEQTKRLESLIRSRKLAFEQVDDGASKGEGAKILDFSVLLGGKTD